MASIQSIDSSELRAHFKEALSAVKRTKKPMVIKQRNIPTAVLVDIDEYEDYLDSRNPALLASITKARKEIKTGKVFSTDDVFGGIK
jgi:prevent-host-death family protein